MPPSTLTPEGKAALRRTIRGLRERLSTELRAEVDSVYGLARADASDLPEAARERRARLLAHVDEHVRSAPAAELKKGRAAVRERVLERFVLEAAHTLVNRLVLLRHMEALSAGKPREERLVPIDVVTKSKKFNQSPAYRAWREHAAELCGDATEGYAALLELVFAELARDLPGLYGDVGLTRLFPVPPATLDRPGRWCGRDRRRGRSRRDVAAALPRCHPGGRLARRGGGVPGCGRGVHPPPLDPRRWREVPERHCGCSPAERNHAAIARSECEPAPDEPVDRHPRRLCSHRRAGRSPQPNPALSRRRCQAHTSMGRATSRQSSLGGRRG